MKILSIVGTRPNFMKVSPLHRAFEAHPHIESSKVLHTGQHYDAKMSDIFFNQLELPEPHFYLGVKGGSHTSTTAHIMLKFEEVLKEERPDLVLVVGDVNSTLACALVAVKSGIRTAHVEAGLRSGDRTMPEEINRVLTDSIADYLFVTEQSGMINLAKEGIADEKVFFVGHVMIDSLIYFRAKASKSDILETLNVKSKDYILMTMHRPHNVDNKEGLQSILKIIKNATKQKTVVFAIHPRTESRYKSHDLYEELSSIDNLILLPPQGYFEFLKLMDNSMMLITDSGGIQEETTYLKVPCITFRDTTERPVTIELGTNFLMKDLNPDDVKVQMDNILNGNIKDGVIPPLWDGKASERIAEALYQEYLKED